MTKAGCNFNYLFNIFPEDLYVSLLSIEEAWRVAMQRHLYYLLAEIQRVLASLP